MERTSKATSTTTTYYPSGNYSITGSTTTLHIGNIATVDTTGTTTTVSTNHTDHLGSTAVVTNSSGTLTELLDYYPYGVERLHMGSSDEQRTYIGEYSDDETSYSYLNARYYNPGTGMFLSEDPVFLGMGVNNNVILLDPQSLNSYSYARNNPIRLSDPSGEFWGLTGINSALSFLGFGEHAVERVILGVVSSVADYADKKQEEFRQMTTDQRVEIVKNEITSGTMGVSFPAPTVASATSAFSKMQTVREMGAQGEAMIENLGIKLRIQSLTGTANYRVPDGMTGTALNEVKNVGYLRLTNQIQDFMKYAQKEGLEFNIFVRENTQISEELQKVVDSGQAILHRVLPKK